MPAGPLGLLPARAARAREETACKETPDRTDPRAEPLPADGALRAPGGVSLPENRHENHV